MLAIIFATLIGCGTPIGQAESLYDACLDTYAVQYVCGNEAAATIDTHAACEGWLADEVTEAVEPGLLDEWNCYNEALADTCDTFTVACW